MNRVWPRVKTTKVAPLQWYLRAAGGQPLVSIDPRCLVILYEFISFNAIESIVAATGSVERTASLHRLEGQLFVSRSESG